ncbi:TetR/AcrR family transcriptional regulator [Amnibacterium flavum]|uniref:TetR family transcriptional regulator n=1 Tax=Amnibacterium flavum TaxID=2173173 RepID=A0A2V1HU94_9MICO|nr:TetR/AcrR family transcriptional regulator [Amnibacterium flavum]PVZ96153.1 TetR family transcriptional regulator [Amnibacterium flavum]
MTATPVRSTYRHGDLRQALLDAGLDLARDGGPDAVVLREATRRVGVSPNAAYRHFADRGALLDAVSAVAQGLAADRIEIEWAKVPADTDEATIARGHLRAVGTGYIGFAREQPGLFRAAFSVPHDLRHAFSPDKAGAAGRTPFQLVALCLDELAAAGVVTPERRRNGEFLAWSTVHGLAMLVIDGPLRGLTPEMIDDAETRLLDMVDRGL